MFVLFEEVNEHSSPDPRCKFRRYRDGDFDAVLVLINSAAISYKGRIPAEHWQEPYMPAAQLAHEIAAGVEFWIYETDGLIIGVMGLQSVRDVDLIRHAYVLPGCQSRGIGTQLLKFLRERSGRRLLIGTWAAARDAIRFYERHGFAVQPTVTATRLLHEYWDVSEEQMMVSVVLAEPDVT